MALSSFISTRRRPKNHESQPSSTDSSQATPPYDIIFRSIIKRATHIRDTFALLTTLLLIISVVSLILVVTGSINANLPPFYFIKLDLRHIIPRNVPNAPLINSITRKLGLHDFYQAGLWGFCVGYGDKVQACSKPKILYFFNPVEIILSELLPGATVAVPYEIISILKLVRITSYIMNICFLVSTCLNVITMFLATLSISIFTCLAALTTTVATIIATVLFHIFRRVINDAAETVNIGCEIGVKMFVFMWMASATSMLCFLIQIGEACCCSSRTDARTGRRRGNLKG